MRFSVPALLALLHVAAREQECKAIFSITTFLSIPGRYELIREALDSFVTLNALDLNLIHKWFLLDEFCKSYNPHVDRRLRELKLQFPQLIIIAKGPSAKGQAHSLNIVLDLLRASNCTYWVHWEESWYAARRFLREAIAAMDEGGLDQLQLTNDWQTEHNDIHDKYEIVYDYWGREEWERVNFSTWGWDIGMWPLYSLRPGIDRASSLLNTGQFSTDPELWPVGFEWDFGRRWLLDNINITKAIVKNPGALRDDGQHNSTYEFDLDAICKEEPVFPTVFVISVGLSVSVAVFILLSVYLAARKAITESMQDEPSPATTPEERADELPPLLLGASVTSER